MVTFLAGGTGTPKLLAGAVSRLGPESVTVVANTGDDVELGGLVVCPDVDTVLFERADLLDRETWWGIAEDTDRVQTALEDLAAAADLDGDPVYLPDEAQTSGRRLARWRRFAAAPPFMHLGDRDRAVHHVRTALLDRGATLTEATRTLGSALDVDVTVLPMSDDPVATIVNTPDGPQHFQEYWVYRDATPRVEAVEFRGAEAATATDAVLAAIRDQPVVIGPSNPVTSIGPMLALPGVEAALEATTVVAVSPFVEDQVFSGPAADLMAGTGATPSTAGVADTYGFADAFVLDTEDGTDLDRPVVHTDTHIREPADATRVVDACLAAIDAVGSEVAP
ncbi:MAG: 2-phospho-L-lactate transferase [Halobacteriaceae archaeon]